MMKSKEIQAVITLENALAALRMDQQVKEMQMKQLWSDLQGEKYLDSIGASTPDKVRRAELNYAEAEPGTTGAKDHQRTEKHDGRHPGATTGT